MSASTDPTSRPRALAAAWKWWGVLYLAALLAGLAGGLWPDAIYPARGDGRSAPLPTLRTVALAQAAFILLAYPMVLFARWRGGLRRRSWAEALVESAGLLIAAAPFYVAAAYLADATGTDAIRTAVYVASLLPLAWCSGAWMARSRWRAWVLVDVLIIALGLPAAYYIAREFLTPDPLDWLRRAAPLTFIWETGASRLGVLISRPIWAACIWSLAGAAGICALALLPPQSTDVAGDERPDLPGT